MSNKRTNWLCEDGIFLSIKFGNFAVFCSLYMHMRVLEHVYNIYSYIAIDR